MPEMWCSQRTHQETRPRQTRHQQTAGQTRIGTIPRIRLEEKHLRAIQAVGISDAGKAKEIQEGAGENADKVQELADQAKEVLGGYFREFTFPQWTTAGWTECDCENPNYEPGLVFDPFAGSGTTIKVANALRYHSWGTDLDTSNFDKNQSLSHYQ